MSNEASCDKDFCCVQENTSTCCDNATGSTSKGYIMQKIWERETTSLS